MKHLVIVLGCMALSACDVFKAMPSTEPPAELNSDWQRSRECSAQADILAKRYGWEPGGLATLASHVNKEENRCFVLMVTSVDPKTGRLSEQVYDGLEGIEIAVWVYEVTRSGQRDVFCNVRRSFESKSTDCDSYHRLMAEKFGGSAVEGLP